MLICDVCWCCFGSKTVIVLWWLPKRNRCKIFGLLMLVFTWLILKNAHVRLLLFWYILIVLFMCYFFVLVVAPIGLIWFFIVLYFHFCIKTRDILGVSSEIPPKSFDFSLSLIIQTLAKYYQNLTKIDIKKNNHMMCTDWCRYSEMLLIL